MKRPLTISCALAVAALMALTTGVAVGAETPYNFSGKTSKDGNGAATHEVSCANGYYVRNSGDGAGTIFDDPYVNSAGTAAGVVVVQPRATSSVAWGHAGSRLATGIAIVVENDRHHRGQSLAYRITLKCTNNVHDAWVILGSSRGAPTTRTETSYTFQGMTKKNGGGTAHNVECASGHYVKSNGVSPGTIFDDPFIDTSGTANGVGVGERVTSSVAWGHAGSRLATGIELWVQNEPTRARRSLAYSITVKCTDKRDDAWVIVG